MPSFSIILPVRNGGNYLKECVTSILSQKYSGFNLLILDNNSSDGSREWLESLGDSRIQIFTSDRDLSIEENWARILSIKKNEYMTLIGHDDLLYPEYLSVMAALIMEFPEASLYQAHFNYIGSNGEPLRACKPMPEIQYAHQFLKSQFLATIDSTGTGYMMRASDYDEAGGIPIRFSRLIYADYALWITLMKKGFKATSSQQTFAYRIHSSTSALTNGEDYLNAFDQYVQFLYSLYKQDSAIRDVILQSGNYFLTENCRSLSHRLLKTKPGARKTSIRQLVSKFKRYAELLIPEQSFHPYRNKGIIAAWCLDNKAGLLLFSLYQKLKRKKNY